MTIQADLRPSLLDNQRIRAVRARVAAMLVGALILLTATAGCGASNVDMRRSGFDKRTTARRMGPVYRELSQAMEPTLSIGTRVIAAAAAPTVGDIVILHPPAYAFRSECGGRRRFLIRGRSACNTSGSHEANIEMVGRVVAGPGDEIYVRGGHVYRRAAGGDGFSREPDSYINACGLGAACDLPVPITIAPGRWFVMGDNRGTAADSRSWGPVPTRWIIGVATSLECPKRRARPRIWLRRTVQQGCAGVSGTYYGGPD